MEGIIDFYLTELLFTGLHILKKKNVGLMLNITRFNYQRCEKRKNRTYQQNNSVILTCWQVKHKDREDS